MKMPPWRGRREDRPSLWLFSHGHRLLDIEALGSASCGTAREILATPALMSIVPFSLGEAETRKGKLSAGEEIGFQGSLLFTMSPERGDLSGGGWSWAARLKEASLVHRG